MRFKDTANNARLKKICDYFKLTNKRVADSYLPRILRAEQLFFYHPVYNPYTESVAYFTPPEMNGDISGTLSGPSVTAMELLKLGVEHAEVLSLPSRKDGSSSCNTSMSSDDSSVTDGFAMTIRDVCKGAYSIKDHQEIVPRYPWELDGGRRSGNSSGWYMRRTLVNALGKPTLNNSSSFNRAHTYSGGSYNTNKPIESTPSSSGRSSSGASLGMNAISSFMLGNNSTSRQPGRSTICSTHQAPSLNRATEPALASGSAGSALVTSAGAGQQQQGLVAGKTASGYFLQSKLSQQHTVTAQPPQQPQHQVQQARTGGSANSQGYSHSRSHLFDSFDLLTATTTASSTVSSAASTSRSGSSASLAFTAAVTSSSLVEEAHTVYDLCEEDSALDDMASSPQRASTSGAHSSAQPVQTEEAAEAVMSVYDVSDSPMVVRAPVGASPLGVSVGAGGEALRSVMLMEDCVVVDLTAASPVQSRKQPRCDLQSFRYKTSAGADDGGCGSGGTGTGVATSPSKLQMLLLSPNTDSQQAQQQPTATTKKFQRLNPEEAKSPDFSHSLEAYALGSESSPSVRQQGAKSGALTHSSVSSSGINSKSILGGGASHNQQQSGVRRKTLGAAPFVPMHIPRAPSTSAASMNTDLAGVVSGGLSGEKRKHNVAAVPVPRKKVTKAQTSGTIMVASIKSFFSAV